MHLRLIALALMAGGQAAASVAQPVIQAVPERPRIVVDGYGEVKTPPDMAVIEYTLRGEGRTSDDAVRAMTAAGMRIEAALHGIDANAEPQTGDVRVTPVRGDACQEREYDSPQLSTGSCAILGYVASQAITVQTRGVKDAGTMVGLAGRGGAFNARISRFDLRDPTAAQQRAMSAALDNAASKAAAIAAASRVSLGQIMNVSTVGQPVVADTLNSLPSVTSTVAFAEHDPVPVKIKPEPITTSARVTVTYAIGQRTDGH
jgi:uncharacterized protein YggE